MKKIHFLTLAALCITAALTVSCKKSMAQSKEYWLGADISSANGMEARGDRLMNFTGDETYELTRLMKNLGLNAVRYRVWVNPQPRRMRPQGGQGQGGPRPEGAPGQGGGPGPQGFPGQGGPGMEAPQGEFSHAGMCDKEDLLENCLRAKALGMEIMVDFHYTDTWADPKKQPIPRAWMGHDYETMKQDLYNHTVEVLQYLKDNGVEPKWVQVGNETRNGLLWNAARREPGEPEDPNNVKVAEHMGHSKLDPEQYAGFINEGHKAVKSVFPDAITIVHLDNGYDQEMYDWNLGILEKYGTQYDMVGMSLYPYWAAKEGGRDDADGVIEDCVANIKHVYERFGKESMIVETGFEVSATDDSITEESYRQFAKAIKETRDNTDGHCKGIFYWAPESLPRGGYALGAFGIDRRPSKIMQAYVEAAEAAKASK